jgi:hypothetical protein
MVGTALKTVMSPEDSRSHAGSGSNCGRISQLAPAASAHPSTFTMPWT